MNRDLHDGLKRVSEIVGDGYRPESVIAGFLSADNLRYIAEKEGIHVCQGNIWSQYAVDNGDGEGSICYPYYPSREHFCKPSRGTDDFIDVVNLDGWTVDFTRYDRPAKEPGDPEPGKQSRNWSLMNGINQKGTRPQDKPVALTELTVEEQALIRRHYPELFAPAANGK